MKPSNTQQPARYTLKEEVVGVQTCEYSGNSVQDVCGKLLATFEDDEHRLALVQNALDQIRNGATRVVVDPRDGETETIIYTLTNGGPVKEYVLTLESLEEPTTTARGEGDTFFLAATALLAECRLQGATELTGIFGHLSTLENLDSDHQIKEWDMSDPECAYLLTLTVNRQ